MRGWGGSVCVNMGVCGCVVFFLWGKAIYVPYTHKQTPTYFLILWTKKGHKAPIQHPHHMLIRREDEWCSNAWRVWQKARINHQNVMAVPIYIYKHNIYIKRMVPFVVTIHTVFSIPHHFCLLVLVFVMKSIYIYMILLRLFHVMLSDYTT